MFIESLAAKAAGALVARMMEAGYKKITASNYTEYEKELLEIIHNTLDEFRKNHPIKETDQIAFYDSQLILDEILKFRTTHGVDKAGIEKALREDQRIITPTKEQLTVFLEIFDKHVKASPKIYDLNLEDNYKEEIFNISFAMQDVQNYLKKILNHLEKEAGVRQSEDALTDREEKLMLRLLIYDSPCAIRTPKGEYEGLWVPGDAIDMQWGWERTPEEAKLSGKSVGDRDNRLRWLMTVTNLVKKGFLKAEKDNHFILSDEGRVKAFQIKDSIPPN